MLASRLQSLLWCCSWLYLGGTLASALSVFMVLRLGSYFLGGRAFVLQTELYGGLLVFIGYVLFDTQVGFMTCTRCVLKHSLLQHVELPAYFDCRCGSMLREVP